MLQDLLDNRVNPIGTQVHRIPHPIVFSLVDRDFLGKSEVLLNLFDYSGEITEVGSVASNLNDPRRQRALQADGYLFMLDPTFPSEPQAKALANFREDVRLVRGIKNSQEIRVPVALCITKIDKLVDQPYASPDGGDAIAEFFRELREIDPTGKARNLNVIEARSQLASRLCDTIWPGFQVERLLRDAFGGRCMLFPTAAFGLDNLGAPDDQKRLVAFGVVEPLLWLLHMNGYPVLD